MAEQASWLREIAALAMKAKIALPDFVDRGMGSAICRNAAGDRFVSAKRRRGSTNKAVPESVEWGLWREQEDEPAPVAIFREDLVPTPERAAFVLSILRGWLLDRWATEQVERAVAVHPNALIGEELLSKTESNGSL